MAGGWTNSHSTHASHTLIALDLILFHLQWKTVHWEKERKKKTGRWEGVRVGGGPFFTDEMKSSCCSDLSEQAAGSTVGQTTGVFFFFFSPPCSLSNYMAQEKAYKERKGWCSTAEVRKMDILTERGRLQTALRFRCSALASYAAFFLPNIHPIRHWGQKQHGILKSKSDCGQSRMEGVSVYWERERNEAKTKKETSGSWKVSRAGIPH